MRKGDPIVVDCFAGGGGASLGIEQALGRPVDEAVNHDPEAVAMHTANHPKTRHWTQDIRQVDPVQVTGGRPVALAWFSPDCTFHSKAKGGKPRNNPSRDLAWVVIDWARAVRPAVIMLENVEEFRKWGPLDEEGYPIKERAGETFDEWTGALRELDYVIDWRELRACDYGAPTIRKRLFLIARCDGLPILWPPATHGKTGVLWPYRTAAECIDWSLPCPSIFDRRKPLAEATLRRIARGVKRFVLDAAEPFIVSLTHHGGDRTRGLGEPLSTVTGAHRGEQALIAPYLTVFQENIIGQDLRQPVGTVMAGAPRFGLVAPTLVTTGYGERDGQAPRAPGLDKPLGTVVAGGTKHALVAAFLAKHFTGVVGAPVQAPLPTILSKGAQTNLVTAHLIQHNGRSTGHEPERPLATVVGGPHLGVVASHLTKLYGTSDAGAALDEPMPTVTAGGQHLGEVQAFLTAYYGSEQDGQPVSEPLRTIPAHDRFALVTVQGEPYVITDIGMRMLTPRELYRAQGFPDGYQIDQDAEGRPFTKTAQIRMCGNSVSPACAEALVRANVVFPHQANLWRGYELATAEASGRADHAD